MIYPDGRYNLNFDICAIIICVFLLLYLVIGQNLKVRRIRSFFWVSLFMLLGSIGELAMDITRNDNGITFQNWQAELATFASHVAHNTVPFLLVLYILSLTGLWHGMRARQFALLSVPETALVVFHLVSPLRHLLYYYHGNCIYERGPAYWFYYIIVACYVLFGAVILISHVKSIRERDRKYVIILCGGFILGMLAGMVNSYIKATNFIQSMFMLGAFFTLENDASLLDHDTGVYNTEALIRDSFPLFRAEYKSYVLSVKLQHMNYFRLMIGMNAVTEILREVGTWMLSIAYEEQTFYRVGNGEFAVLLFNKDEAQARDTTKKISERFSRPWSYSGGLAEITIPAQIWVSSIPDRISSEEQVLAFAETAFDDKKPDEHLIIADEMQEEQRQIDVNVAIRRAIKNNGFEVYYQPIYDTRSGKIHSCEALVRMNDPEIGFVSPEEFIKVAEQTGSITRIGEIVFEQVCRFLSEQHPEQYGMDFVEVNLSTIQCMDTNLVSQLQSIMQKYGISPKQIVLEITESAVIHNEGRVNGVVKELQEAGFHFALDDFGTGHANLSYLRKFPFQIIKIDKSFLWAAEKNETDGTILRNMLNLVHDLKLQTVVEGVETLHQRDAMIQDGVNYLQGYYYSKPVPGDRFLDYIHRFNQMQNSEAN